jgi:UDPglucose--hexose-1-phosphate uridylyltransferase
LDLVLRNNLTTEEHPLGLYHPHAELHHIKKENIGPIEVMGLAVLPSRLKGELEELAKALKSGTPSAEFAENIQKHASWADDLRYDYDFENEDVERILEYEVGRIFAKVLEDAGVYKLTPEGREGFVRFLESV